jgi:hypothetical protein
MSRKAVEFLLIGALALAGAEVRAACSAGTPNSSVAESTPDSRFLASGDGTVIDQRTRLVWKRCAEGQTWDVSSSTCTGGPVSYSWADALALAKSTSFAGRSDWRLPNRKELESIVEFCGHSPAINLAIFPATPSERFWSSSTYLPNTGSAWEVYFFDGYAGASNKGLPNYVRLVRDGTSLTPVAGP